MKTTRIFIIAITLVSLIINGKAISQIASVNSTTINCGQCTTITATMPPSTSTNNYLVTSIPYNPVCPFNSGTPININIDDTWSSILTIPFSLSFFGNTYNQLIVGGNGLVSFDLTSAGAYCPWSYSTTCPSTSLPTNSIFGVYHDIDPGVTGTTTYQVLGSHPNRAFVVNWYQVAMFSGSCNSLLATHQIVMYESTNVIEVYVQNKPLCSSWNGGNALIGIQNSSGTVGISPPGRNTGQWTAQNEAWRFAQCAILPSSLHWTNQNGDTISNSQSITVCPTMTSDFYFSADFICSGNTLHHLDSITVIVNPIAVNIGNDTSLCAGQQITLQADTSYNTYLWSSNATTPTIVVSQPGIYSLSVTDTVGCIGSDLINITNGVPVLQPNVNGYNFLCIPDTLQYSIPAPPDAISYFWYYTGSGTLIYNPATNPITMQFSDTATNGTLIAKAIGLCGISADSITKNISIVTSLNAGYISSSDTGLLCPDESTTLNIVGHLGNIEWWFSTNNIQWNLIPGAHDSIYQTLPTDTSKYYKAAIVGGCPTKFTDSIWVEILPANTDSLCHVTYDPTYGKTKICWKKNTSHLADTVFVFAYEFGAWTLLGFGMDADESYIDMSSTPQISTKIYAITKTNLCHIEGGFSTAHNSYHLAYHYDIFSNEHQLTWSMYYGINNNSYFKIFGITPIGTHILIDSVSPTQYSFSLPHSGNIYNYFYVGFDAPTCNTQPTNLVITNYVAAYNVSIAEYDNTVFKITPNPALTNISIIGNIKEGATYKISDMIGRVILTNPFTNTPIDISNLATGVYFVTIGSSCQKFIKQ